MKPLDSAFNRKSKKRKDGTLRVVPFNTTFKYHQRSNLKLKARAAGLTENEFIVLKCGLNNPPKQ